MAPLSKLLQALSFISLFLMLANNYKLVHSQAVTSFAYDFFSRRPNNLTYQGGALVPPVSNFLRLTATDSSCLPTTWSAGRVLYTRPVRFWESGSTRQASFETTMDFLITPSRTGAADGVAFFIAPVNTTIPNNGAGANLGIFGASGTTTSLFAVEFDTFVNGEWDPNYRHIGIDIQSRVSRSVARFDSATGQLVHARINYNAVTRNISVVARSGTQTASLSFVFNLRTILPQMVQVGISSATGQFASDLGVHDIVSWRFASSLVFTGVINDEKAYI